MDNRTIDEVRRNEDRLINKIELLEKENQELKKQLNDYKNRYTNRLNSQLAENIEPDEEDFYLSEIEIKANYYDKLVSKQKDFIEYLEDEIKECNSYSKYIKKKLQELKSRSSGKSYIANEIMKNEISKKIFNKVLSKYKELVERSNDYV